MRLIEVKILYNADYPSYNLNTEKDVCQFIQSMLQRPDVISISKIRIAEGGGDDDEQ